MSRSFKKHPEYGYPCCGTATKDKHICNKKRRAHDKQIIRNCGSRKILVDDGDDDWYWTYEAGEICQADMATKNIYDQWCWNVDGPKIYNDTVVEAQWNLDVVVERLMESPYTTDESYYRKWLQYQCKMK